MLTIITGTNNRRKSLHITRLSYYLLAGCLLLLMPQVSGAGTIEGIIFTGNGPAKDATVSAYLSYKDLTSGQAYRKSEPGNHDGQFTLNLPPGSYYLVAHAKLHGNNYFSYHGVNPISVTDDYRWLPFLLVGENGIKCQNSPGQSNINGIVSYKGKAVSGGVVSVYPQQDGKFRGMGLLTNTLDTSGSFSLALEPGSYVVIARKKQDIKGIGPVKRGDLFCYPSTNPITLASNQTCDIDINCYPRDDLEIFLDAGAVNPQGRRHESRRQASLYDLQPSEGQKPPSLAPTTISGLVTDSHGTPRSGLIVTAYPARGLDLFQMNILRLITSNMGQTDSSGRYKIELKDGDSKYYIVAREKVGEAPERAEYYGLYEGSPNHSVTPSPGSQLTDIDVVVDRIMPPQCPEKP